MMEATNLLHPRSRTALDVLAWSQNSYACSFLLTVVLDILNSFALLEEAGEEAQSLVLFPPAFRDCTTDFAEMALQLCTHRRSSGQTMSPALAPQIAYQPFVVTTALLLKSNRVTTSCHSWQETADRLYEVDLLCLGNI